MPKQIKKLPQEVVSKIAAGEVIERPASVVKELVENSIDADSDKIEIKVNNGGKDLIQVIDTGYGMTREDAELALERHATSKITEANDLFSIRSLGFRGEALPSIAAISRLTMKTRTEDKLGGTLVKINGGEIKKIEDAGCPIGTNIIVKDLFYNTPVRYKYLKTSATEIRRISDIVNRLALAYPEITFKLSHNQKKVLETPGNGNLMDTILSVYGKEVAKSMIAVDYEDKYMQVSGYVSKPNISRASKKHQSFFINRRYIKSRALSEAISKAYHTLLAKGRHPIAILTIKLNPVLVDVNVHPTKMEVNFSREKEVASVLQNGVKEALSNADLIPEVKLNSKDSTAVSKKDSQDSKQQQELELTKKRKFSSEKNKKKSQKKEKSTQKTTNDNQDKSIQTDQINETKESSDRINRKESAEELKNGIEKQSKQADYFQKREQSNEKEKKNKESVAIKESQSDYNKDDATKSLSSFLPLGQIHNTYIIAQGEDGFYIVDQHAAHERILYNELMEKFKQAEIKSQSLLMPVRLELTNPEIEILEENSEHLKNLGFEFEAFGGQTYLVRAVPNLLHKLDIKELCLDIIDNLLDKGKIQEPTEIIEDLLVIMSCRGAIKSGKSLVPGEMESLLQQLEESGNQHTCPHGRPTIIHFSKKELDKKFKRI
ncbi:DNA mismatch repair endonuclease MutL [Acetohalobium arabaticum]|uniref:DNA mismatch repair protein MutL n=1 Tax=Acetohalobium arabaticum (strain ATCC 49924 / DSM 5501 / Z-7288) TaxID=574087 RepID=D9QQ88_ACEAZ|nr:DNA mismatch repair endonuclease MutL [Acetohalobium arabaticum]ADL12679.1 DNA mismatch repair protein MutL [Acetohalobium arabaticum DSM 5501]